jgi:two-component system, NtrC family, sensor histidine kinase GlrK
MMQARFRRLPARYSQARRRMGRWLRANSLLGLLLAGFLLVTAPLVAGLLVSSMQIERVTRSSERLLEQALSSTHAVRAIEDRMTALERAARQYLVLHDAEARLYLVQQGEALGRELDQLRSDGVEPEWDALLYRLGQDSWALTEEVLRRPQTEVWPESLRRRFSALEQASAQLQQHSELAAEEAGRRLESLGDQARSRAVLQLAFSLILAFVLAMLFTARITRPIGKLDQGIRALARPESGPLPKVKSPRDLRALSVRLEWVRRKLARIERDRQRLLGQVSHELKTPLSAISEGISLLDDEAFGVLGAQQRELVVILKSNVARLQEQIESLLRYNRLRSGHRPARSSRLRVSDLIEQALQQHALTFAAGQVKPIVQLDPAAEVTGDRDMLLTALDNLVSNAMKYSGPEVSLGIFLTAFGREVQIDVADRGPGVRPGDRARILEPFFRGHEAANTNTPGSGLGLVNGLPDYFA